jgi:CubicO group peptidase (beta-lactamase class C family)
MSLGTWSECAPRGLGMRDAEVGRAAELVRAYGGIAQLCVLRHGQVVLDRQVRCTPRALFWLFSASKPFIAAQVHLLAERGAICLDDPVAAYWPEYARHGKEGITVRHVLTHRAGVPFASGSEAGDALTMTRWHRAVRQAQEARPRWPAGQVLAYHPMTWGFILGEVVRRVTGQPLASQLATDLLRPAGLGDTYLGVPGSARGRCVPVAGGRLGDRAQAWIWNRRSVRQAVIPAAGVSTTARDLARFYQMLLDGGRLDGGWVMSPGAIAEATRVSSETEIDRTRGWPVRYGHGFQLGSPGRRTGMGRMASSQAFGHAGSRCVTNAWADPARGVVFVYLTSRLAAGDLGVRHQCQVSDAILAACG